MTAAADKSISSKNTVFALSTPVGGAIAVIRASGPLARPVLSAIFTGRIIERQLCFGRITDDASVIDECMAVFFPAPNSYTGEDMFELDLHGSYAVVTAVSKLLEEKGLEIAPAGEFTKRAFLNGRMDLVQADAVMDLINAETRRAANAAMDQLRGGLSARIASIEDRLISLASELGAAMDYPEEMEDEVLSSVPDALDPVISELDALIANGRRSRLVRDGAKLVILGRPNAGKSSLLNALLNEERAIVTDIAGTTRDILEEKLNLSGLPVRLVDTAGLREGADTIEKIGIDRANRQAETADCVFLVFDGARPIDGEDEALIEKTKALNAVFVINKADLDREGALRASDRLKSLRSGCPAVIISCRTREGLDELKRTAAKLLGAGEESAIVTNERHISRLEYAKAELEMALAPLGTDLIAEHIATALSATAEITGREYSEELLDMIFSRFCVGK